MRTSFKILITSIAIGCSLPAAADSVLNISDHSMEPSIILPESYETDTKKMLENWYLRNYAILDYEADGKPSSDVSDQVLLERLSALPTVIEMPLNSVVKNTIKFYIRKQQLVENMLGLSLYYMPIFRDALERHGMPLELQYLPVIESALVPEAVSKAGAVGLWQMMPATGGGLGLEINSLVDQRRDPYASSDAAARYLKQLYETFNDWSLAIAAYNCGPGNVNKALRRAGEGKHDFWEIYPFLPAETRGYVPAFIAANYIMTYHKDHNISPALAKRPIIVDSIHVNKRVHFDQISQVLDIPMTELRALNPQYRKDMIPGDIKPYTLVLPSLQVYAYIANEDSILNHDASKYARRGIVEPASGATTGRDSKGEYYDEETTQYHKVKKGETLQKIANKYGVTVAQIKKYNKVGKSVKAGQNLKIVSVTRKYKPTPLPEPEVEATDSITTPQNVAPGDSISATEQDVADAFSGSAQDEGSEEILEKEETAAPAPAVKKETPKPAPAAKKETTKAAAPATTTTHTVRKGDTLGKISKQYGVTINAIKKANNLKNDNINVGQKLKIPAK